MTKQIKKLYAEYKKAHEITERVELDMSEEIFDRALDYECEKFDELIEALLEFTEGQIDEFDLRALVMNAKYADRFEKFIGMLAA